MCGIRVEKARKKAKIIWEKIKEVAEFVVNEKIHPEGKNKIWKEGTKVRLGCQYIINHYSEMIVYLEKLLGDKNLRERLGQRARETIIEKFSQEKFITNWNNVFDAANRMNK